MRRIFFTGLALSLAAMFAADAGVVGSTVDALEIAGVTIFLAAPFAFGASSSHRVPAARRPAGGAVLAGTLAAAIVLLAAGVDGARLFDVAVGVLVAAAALLSVTGALLELVADARRDGLLVSLGLTETRHDGRRAA